MLYIAADHAGYELKEYITHQLASRNISFEDFGTFEVSKEDSYVKYANQLVKVMQKQSGSWGILICGSGVGMSIAANRHHRIRAALIWNTDVAKRAREEDDANIICLPARLMSEELAWQCVSTFLATTFSHEDRYKRRVSQLDAENSR